MQRLVSAVFTASRRSLSWLFRCSSRAARRDARLARVASPPLLDDRLDTILGARRLVVTPAQAAAFVTRSSAWRCVSCGKVHAFDRPVRVGAASPCSCLQIEFESDVRKRPAGYPSLRALAER